MIACEKYGVETIELQNISQNSGHPDILGMRQIEEQVENYLMKTREG